MNGFKRFIQGVKAMPKRLQLSRRAGWRISDQSNNYAVVARPGKYGNPFEVGKHGASRADVVTLYRRWLGGEDFPDIARKRPTADELAGLIGKDLACWCPIDGPCHADILLEHVNQTGKP